MTMRVCKAGHPTNFPRSCPVCAAMKLRAKAEAREHKNRSDAAIQREAHKREVG